MSTNEAAARMLEEIARMMEVLGEDAFRVNAHTRAARAVEGLSVNLEDLAKDRSALLEVQGIGPKMAEKLIEYCVRGTMSEHAELCAKVPAGVLALMQVPGVGPKTARSMWKEGGIENVAQLERAISDGSILNLPRMGAKTVEKIKASIAFAKTSSVRLWLGRADAVARRFVQSLQAHPGVARVMPAGSLRRGKETIGDIDILVAMKEGREGDAHEVVALFNKAEGVSQVLAAGESKSSVRVALGHDTGRWKLEGKEGEADAGPSVQVDLRVLPLASWGSGLQYFTGSKEHNVRLREKALKMGFTLSDWGLFPLDGESTPPHLRGVKPIASATEEEIYAKLKLPYLPPEVREDQGEFELKDTPKLIELEDIKAELHAHTTASDGTMSIEELARRAQERGFHTIAVTDHSRSSVQANGLSVDRLMEHIENVRRAREIVRGITILAGSEVDIKADGTLDYEDKVLRMLDVVVASPHVALSQDPESATRRLVAAIRHPLVHILGHPTGRLLNKRAGLSPDMAQLVAAAKECHTALEINAHWMRLDLKDVHVRAGVRAGCLFAIDCDVHAPADYDNLRYGVATARRGWMTPNLCVNTWSAAQLHGWLQSKR